MPNPLQGSDNRPMYIVKKEQRDEKRKFSSFELELRHNVDINYPDIKKVGDINSDAGNHHTNCRPRYESSKTIKTKKKKKRNKKKNPLPNVLF